MVSPFPSVAEEALFLRGRVTIARSLRARLSEAFWANGTTCAFWVNEWPKSTCTVVGPVPYCIIIVSKKCQLSAKWVYIIILENVSCEIEDFVETRLCKLRGILRSRVLGVLCDHKDVSPYWGNTIWQLRNSVSVQIISGCGYVCDLIYIGWT